MARKKCKPEEIVAKLRQVDLLWQKLDEEGDVAGMETFLERFSLGPFAPVARLRIAELRSGSDPSAAGQAVAALEPSDEAPRALTLVEEPTAEASALATDPETPMDETGLDPATDAASLARTDEIAPNLLQISLAALGHYEGRIDGIFGPASRRAAAAFQKQSGFQATGDLRPEEIVRLVVSAAEAGDAASQNTLGIMFATGAGVTQDYVVAAEWFGRSADSGNSFGQMNLGLLYKDGLGVERDAARARTLLQRAVENGRAEAQTVLAELD